MNHHKNIVRIQAVHSNLHDLKNKVVFVGGATISLYADRETIEVRPTDDIDVIIELLNYSERAKLEEKLRAIGFQHDLESNIICRYKIQHSSVYRPESPLHCRILRCADCGSGSCPGAS
jgi:hypothetical protein